MKLEINRRFYLPVMINS